MNAIAASIEAGVPAGRAAKMAELERARAENARASNMGWEVDRIAASESSKRLAWKIAGAAVFVAIMAVAAVLVQGPLRVVEPVPIVVDRVTGETSVGYRLAADAIPPLDALDMHNVARFMRAREGYSWSFLQSQYDTVLRMGTPETFGEYSKQFEGDNALDKKLGAGGEIRVNVTLIRLPPGGRIGNRGEATVAFEKVTRMPNQPNPEIKRYVGTLRYEYRPDLLAKQQDRIENPFGFVVTAYRADIELSADSVASAK
jgi:type IV secretion system protein VirB8